MIFWLTFYAEIPGGINPEQYIHLVDQVHTWDGYMWACGLVVFFTFFFLGAVFYGVRAAKSVIKENKEINVRYTGALEKYAGLLATYTQTAQELTREHQGIIKEQQTLDRVTNDLIRADTNATNLSAKRSEEQTKALEVLKETVQRLWERNIK